MIYVLIYDKYFNIYTYKNIKILYSKMALFYGVINRANEYPYRYALDFIRPM